MMGKTHLLIGGAAWLGVMVIAKQETPMIVAAGWAIASLGALAPDIDSKHSLISQLVQIPFWRILGGHRKITHALLGLAIVAGAFAALMFHPGNRLLPWIGYAFMTGWISHILADMTTREGCPLLWPLDKTNYGLHAITTGEEIENKIVRPLAAFANLALLVFLIGWV